MIHVAMQVVSPLAVGTMATLPQSRGFSEREILSNPLVPCLQRSKLKRRGTCKAVRIVSANLKQADDAAQCSKPVLASGIFSSAMGLMLASEGTARALTKDDVGEAYTQVELFTTQVTTTAQSVFETAKSLFDQVFTTVKPGFDAAFPYVQQTTETVTKFVGPLASDIAGEAQKALRNAGVDPDPGVEFAKNAAEQTSKVLEGAQPVGSSVYKSALAAEPLFLAEAAGGLILFYFLAPVVVSTIVNKARGYAGNLAAAQALDLLQNQDYALIDIRTEKEKGKSGVPSLPSNAKNKYVAVPLEELTGKVKSQVRNSRKVEGEIAALKISALKRLSKGSKIVIMDESGDIAKVVARVLKNLGFKNTFVINDGFKGGRGWIQSKLGIEEASSPGGFSFSEVLSPSRIIPEGTRKYGSGSEQPRTQRLKLLPGGDE